MGKAFSKPLGALRLQELFLRTDPPRTADLHRLDEYIEERIGSAVRRIGATRIDRVVGTSATASAVVCAVNRIPRARRELPLLAASCHVMAILLAGVQCFFYS